MFWQDTNLNITSQSHLLSVLKYYNRIVLIKNDCLTHYIN